MFLLFQFFCRLYRGLVRTRSTFPLRPISTLNLCSYSTFRNSTSYFEHTETIALMSLLISVFCFFDQSQRCGGIDLIHDIVLLDVVGTCTGSYFKRGIRYSLLIDCRLYIHLASAFDTRSRAAFYQLKLIPSGCRDQPRLIYVQEGSAGCESSFIAKFTSSWSLVTSSFGSTSRTIFRALITEFKSFASKGGESILWNRNFSRSGHSSRGL